MDSPRVGDALGEGVVLSVRNVSKKFCKSLKRSMFYGLTDLARDLVGVRNDTSSLRKDEFWAVDDISLELRKGQVLGIIGPNGSGKTTLMRLLSGIYPPDRGEVVVRGRSAILMSHSAGIHPHMTGRENVYLRGAILGMSRAEIDSKFDSILEFSGIGEFIDSPMATYSTGMKVRLMFSVSIAIRPDVLLLDEVLAVGDQGFRTKCYNEIKKLSKDSAIVLVTHSVNKVTSACTDIIVVDHGRKVFHGNDIQGGVDCYFSRVSSVEGSVSGAGAYIYDVRLSAENGAGSVGESLCVEHRSPLAVNVTCSLDTEAASPFMVVSFLDREFNVVAQSRSDNGLFKTGGGRKREIRVRFHELSLNPGAYYVNVSIIDEETKRGLAKAFAVERFRVTGAFDSSAPVTLSGSWSGA